MKRQPQAAAPLKEGLHMKDIRNSIKSDPHGNAPEGTTDTRG